MRVLSLLLSILALQVNAQDIGGFFGPTRTIRFFAANPATCSPSRDNIGLDTTLDLIKVCSADNVWTSLPTLESANAFTNAVTISHTALPLTLTRTSASAGSANGGLFIDYLTTGTPAANIGVSILLRTEDSANNTQEAVRLAGALSSVTDGAENGYLLVGVTSGGTVNTSAMRIEPNVTTQYAATNGAMRISGVWTELITLNTGATTTDSTTDLPANSVIDSVACRVTTTITTAANWSVGDPTTAARFSAANSTLTAGTTSVGLDHRKGAVSTDAAGPTQITAAKLRITTNANPGAGAIRCTVFYTQFTAPTS